MNQTILMIYLLQALAAGPPEAAKRQPPAEVELSGTLRIKGPKPPGLVAYVSREPCDPEQGLKNAIRSVQIDPNVATNFFIEIFVPQGSTGHVCGAATDKQGKFIAFGAYPKNPLTFRGRGEVTFSQVVIDLRPLKEWKAKSEKSR